MLFTGINSSCWWNWHWGNFWTFLDNFSMASIDFFCCEVCVFWNDRWENDSLIINSTLIIFAYSTLIIKLIFSLNFEIYNVLYFIKNAHLLSQINRKLLLLRIFPNLCFLYNTENNFPSSLNFWCETSTKVII